MGGEMSPVMMAALITGLRVKKETIGEITAAAQVMREFSTKVNVSDKTHLVDIVGTGGDGSHTFNISTCSMFVAAAAGAKVSKHGGRSVSSKSGSADVMESLGIKINLSPEAMQRGWDCLARFGERLAGFGKTQVRAVATQTLREAVNRKLFIEHAQAKLGFPIEVIAGLEEARLIYQGVAHFLPQADQRRLVVDIGGRSTGVPAWPGTVWAFAEKRAYAGGEVESIREAARAFLDLV